MKCNCSDPTYVFSDFSALQSCHQQLGGHTGSSRLSQLVSTCLNDYCSNPFLLVGGCENWKGPAELRFGIGARFYFLFKYTYFNNTETCTGVKADTNSDMAGPGVK